MSAKSTLSTITAKIAEVTGAKVKAEQLLCELKKQEQWALGEQRRARLDNYADEARSIASGADQTRQAIANAATAVTTALVNLAALASQHNAAVADLHQKINAEHPKHTSPASPADSYTTTSGSAVVAQEVVLYPVDGDTLISKAIKAATGPGSDAVGVPLLADSRDKLHCPAGPYFRHATHGGIFIGEQPQRSANSAALIPITRAEYLASTWGLNLSDLPTNVVTAMGDRDQAQFALAKAEETTRKVTAVDRIAAEAF